jgi:hypothetical protein
MKMKATSRRSIHKKLPSRLNVLFHIQPKRQNQIDNNRREWRDERGVNEKQTDVGRCNSHTLAEIRANAERVFFYV